MAVNHLAFNLDNHEIAASFADGGLKILNASKSSQESILVPGEGKQSGHVYTSLKWINEESLLTVNSNARISIFNTSMGVKVHDELDNEEENQLFTLDVNRKNKIFAVAGQAQKIHIYDLETMQGTHQILTSPSASMKEVVKIGGIPVHIDEELVGHSNRIYSVKFDPLHPFLIYSGGWDSYILINDIILEISYVCIIFFSEDYIFNRAKGDEKVGDIFGPLIGGETIDVKGHYLTVGAFSKNNYLQVYDNRNMKECVVYQNIEWGEAYGQEEIGFIQSCKNWNTPTDHFKPLKIECFIVISYNHLIVAASARSKDVKMFSHNAGRKQSFREVTHLFGLNSGVLALDTSMDGKVLAVGTSTGEVVFHKSEGVRFD